MACAASPTSRKRPEGEVQRGSGGNGVDGKKFCIVGQRNVNEPPHPVAPPMLVKHARRLGAFDAARMSSRMPHAKRWCVAGTDEGEGERETGDAGADDDYFYGFAGRWVE
ncbi:hypothetical protein MY11210_002706 [Beauveria gryllotalpidicola]